MENQEALAGEQRQQPQTASARRIALLQSAIESNIILIRDQRGRMRPSITVDDIRQMREQNVRWRAEIAKLQALASGAAS